MEGFLVQGKADVRPVGADKTPAILLSRPIAEKMQVRQGQEVIMSFIMQGQQIKRRFYVNGIYKTGMEEYDKRLCLVDIEGLRSILGWPQDEVQGMEVILDDIRDMDVIADYIYSEILPAQYYAETVRQKFPSIFDWLNLQDINEEIIISLMILVAIINMVTVLLILILERTQMIGVLTSLGMSNAAIRGIFLYHAAYIILYGLVMGNFLGLGIAWLQMQTGFIKLDEANYYLDSAPVLLEWGPILWINAGTFVVTLLTLILPTYLVTRISPVKALRFS
jgi:lipoprotein-releasing system permease protein